MKKVLIISLLASTINTFGMEMPTEKQCKNLFNQLKGNVHIVDMPHGVSKNIKNVTKESFNKNIQKIFSCMKRGNIHFFNSVAICSYKRNQEPYINFKTTTKDEIVTLAYNNDVSSLVNNTYSLFEACRDRAIENYKKDKYCLDDQCPNIN